MEEQNEEKEDEGLLLFLKGVSKWSIEEMLSLKNKKPEVIFKEMSYSRHSLNGYRNFYLNLDERKHEVIRLKFYFDFSFSEKKFQSFSLGRNPYITGVVFMEISSLNVLGFDFEIKEIAHWHSNFIGLSYLPFVKKLELNGNIFYNYFLLKQRSLEEKFQKEFKEHSSI